MENEDVIRPSPYINFPLKKKKLHFCEAFPSNITSHQSTPKNLQTGGWTLLLP